ncbi:hypothetical protein SKAU_G00280150 [Synaphobranchus kaupii]|uniref:Uncharacterized protein n=1 Tax=Synaphobranchus kaupii TaxID=118154 RepID=A0A9Q1IMY0_SYNKA|nr:hypothetical protein SKAU_G00280150 [Synaphobranchus kaupii]
MVMRGSKTGLETRVRQNHCPTLLGVDGDSCHHIHNAAKVFAAPFSSHLERLFSDLHADHQWASDQLTYLREICDFMSIPGSAPKRFVQHCWLSAYDVAISTQRLLPAYKVLYYVFMDKEDKGLYKDPLKQLFADYNVSEKAQTQIRSFHEDLSKKGMTQLGKDRKKRWFRRCGMKPPQLSCTSMYTVYRSAAIP